MAFSTQRAVSDGTLILLGVSIGYIKQADIGVFYNGLPAGAGTWSWVGTTTNIAFSPAVPAGVEVLLARTTQIDKIINRFTAGAGFTNQSMDTDFQQVLYLNQEAVEGSALTDVFSDVDFHGFKVRNVGTATDSGDAVSLGQYQADALGASAFKDAAAASASAALTSQNAALVSQNAALVSQNASAASAVTSGNSASASGTSASNSDASRVAAVAAQAAAVAARTGAETALDNFDDRYLGSKSTDPTLDNDGNALLVGALYWNTSIPALRVWNGTAPWITFPSVTAGGISNTPAGTISATTVQAALNELETEKAKSGANTDITSLDATLGATTPKTGAFTALSYTTTLTGGAGLVNLGFGQFVKDVAGNIGVGVVPNAWRSGTPSLQVGGSGACLSSDSGVVAELSNNVFLNSSSQFIIQRSDLASKYQQYQGNHRWHSAPNGTAGNVATFTETMQLDAVGNLYFNSGVGSTRLAYGCRTWVNFNGIGTVSIRGSGNVSSITDISVGTYAVNLITAMPDANYSISGTCSRDGGSTPGIVGPRQQSDLSAVSFIVVTIHDGGTGFDSGTVSVSIVR